MSIKEQNIVNEPQLNWGGDWTERKLNAFSKYVSAYLKIMNSHPYWKTIYFDGFAGSGDRLKKQCNDVLYNKLFSDDYEETGYKGAAERVLTLPGNNYFDYYYFIDSDKDSLNKLENKISSLTPKSKVNIQYKLGNCNDYLIELSLAMKREPKSFASLVFLDPFGMQINWSSIAQLAETRTDIWILVPTGVIINRLLDRDANLIHSIKLQSFFGLEEKEIRNYFYKKETIDTLFGEQELVHKISKPIEKIAELYIRQLKTLWKFVTEEPLRLENRKGVPIFHFVFASNNINAVKIAKQIIKNI